MQVDCPRSPARRRLLLALDKEVGRCCPDAPCLDGSGRPASWSAVWILAAALAAFALDSTLAATAFFRCGGYAAPAASGNVVAGSGHPDASFFLILDLIKQTGAGLQEAAGHY